MGNPFSYVIKKGLNSPTASRSETKADKNKTLPARRSSQDERPIDGGREALASEEIAGLKPCLAIVARGRMAMKFLHEQACRLVQDRPQAIENCQRAAKIETSRQAEKIVAGNRRTHTGFACRQDH